MAKDILAGIDIGNSTTEIAIAEVGDRDPLFLSQHLVPTTGVKGTAENIHGIVACLEKAAEKAGIKVSDLSRIRLNDAVPVIGDLAMDLISETIITESSMIGHNPDTPGGGGIGVGETVMIDELPDQRRDKDFIVVVPESFDYEWVAYMINRCIKDGISVKGAIIQKDDGVLVHNRLQEKIPIVDEVDFIEKVPLHKLAAVEVALSGHVIRMLSNPYGLATVFGLSPEETRQIAPVAKSLVGIRSAVVIRTPQGEIVERKIEAGNITLVGDKDSVSVPINDGAERIMKAYENIGDLVDVQGEMGTNVGGMLNGLRQDLANLTGQDANDIHISDMLAVDAGIPTSISGAMAGEIAMEQGVALASMVKTEKLSVHKVADLLQQRLDVEVEVGGIEAEMAMRGALTTPGTEQPLVILDMGGGSTDAASIDHKGQITTTHLAGAGDMVTLVIKSELALEDADLAEKIKKYPLGKVISLFHMQLEDGTISFTETPYAPETYGKVVIREDSGLTPLPIRDSLEKIRHVRREAKRKVFVTNALRALEKVSPTQNLRHLSFVVMLGGSALDFEIPQMITEELSKYSIVAGFANTRGTEGPRNAVATGLILSVTEGVANGS
ncbi:diol dehydratase reactivase alpha subunit [Fictibacillus enclensis]|uniref:Diol dehydratase reactivase subunit alpha n=1 Tax=Fictibacillus enclensis TaxID=1017270 RepID=A0A0V8JEA9_9BACL|nr:diol dehydratase reactivase subunit alpha [Fictibacillus enclensis]KSU85478.1 diol dehydratase reactivase subunit alpha [Fictibacillus enclensis]SCB97467.1 diol dehydratase reactivase alpha subunit [Fictibacillus enclensis]